MLAIILSLINTNSILCDPCRLSIQLSTPTSDLGDPYLVGCRGALGPGAHYSHHFVHITVKIGSGKNHQWLLTLGVGGILVKSWICAWP